MCMRGVCSSGLAVGVGLVSLTALVTGFVSNVWLYTREPVSLPNNQPPTTITFRIGFWRVCPALNKTNYTIIESELILENCVKRRLYLSQVIREG
uniref:Uncharacterized protein n=1 Tax=Rhodnius prolixus TaxID=13249 RepID=T1HGD0_RHOPR